MKFPSERFAAKVVVVCELKDKLFAPLEANSKIQREAAQRHFAL